MSYLIAQRRFCFSVQMENYRKLVKSTEKEAEDELAIMRLELDASLVLDANVVHMNVKLGSKVANLLSFASTKFEKEDQKQITWNGSADAINKVVACAEMMKKRFKNLYQINKIGYIRREEIWKARVEDLRDIRVVKEIPCMCIILSKTPLNPNETGYQTNATVDELFKVAPTKKPQQADSNKRHKNADHQSAQQHADSQAPDGVYVRKKKQIKK